MRASPLRRPLQVFAFVRKEITDVAHQPRLLTTLVLAPFLILLAFGLGYRNQTRPFRAWFVAPAGSPFVDRVRIDEAELGTAIHVVGSGPDEALARSMLQDGRLDVVVVFPADPLGAILDGQRAQIRIVHDRIDPIEQTAIDFASRLAVDEVNAQVLAGIVTSGQQEVGATQQPLAAATELSHGATSALDRGDVDTARQQLDDLARQVGRVRAGVGVTASLVDQFDAPGAGSSGASAMATRMSDDLTAVGQQLGGAQSSLAAHDPATARQQLGDATTALQAADADMGRLAGVQAKVLVRPFVSHVEALSPGRGVLSDYYAPPAVMLLLQQFGVAFGALSFVRERQLGVHEVFRVAPLGAVETVVGKYLGYAVVGTGVAAALMALVVKGLDVPMTGRWSDAAIALALTLVASIGLGLVISLASPNDTQAVQLTMITLLASLLFSGFFLSVDRLDGPARALSWALPATFGNRLLRDVLLRGRRLEPSTVLGLATYAAVAFLLTLAGTRRRLSGST